MWTCSFIENCKKKIPNFTNYSLEIKSFKNLEALPYKAVHLPVNFNQNLDLVWGQDCIIKLSNPFFKNWWWRCVMSIALILFYVYDVQKRWGPLLNQSRDSLRNLLCNYDMSDLPNFIQNSLNTFYWKPQSEEVKRKLKSKFIILGGGKKCPSRMSWQPF